MESEDIFEGISGASLRAERDKRVQANRAAYERKLQDDKWLVTVGAREFVKRTIPQIKEAHENLSTYIEVEVRPDFKSDEFKRKMYDAAIELFKLKGFVAAFVKRDKDQDGAFGPETVEQTVLKISW